ncbi:hypothetical protein E3N88_05968 [Mikania micrantha]|uniref:Uncharacterized protein n=1 Tax=Mikania micrantha TaxID=192012 RepID=A0A5N6PNB0_9ASTR|nr:hypothetical protein E3N88_05968 [Mikania micrantha]
MRSQELVIPDAEEEMEETDEVASHNEEEQKREEETATSSRPVQDVEATNARESDPQSSRKPGESTEPREKRTINAPHLNTMWVKMGDMCKVV